MDNTELIKQIGFKDKNGTDIKEFDLLGFEKGTDIFFDRALVMFIKDRWVAGKLLQLAKPFRGHVFEGLAVFLSKEFENLVVIGHAYENPELLIYPRQIEEGQILWYEQVLFPKGVPEGYSNLIRSKYKK